MIEYLRKVLYILSESKKNLLLLFSIFLISSFLEVVGVGLIAPYLRIISDPLSAYDSRIIGYFLRAFNWQNYNEIVIGSSIILIVVFIIKSFSYYSCKAYIGKFSYQQKALLESRLLSSYLNSSYVFHLDRNTADLVQNIAVESLQFTVNCLIPLLEIVSNSIVLILLMTFLSLAEPLFVVILMMIFLPTTFLFVRLSKSQKKWGEISSRSQKEIIQSINHGLGGLKETRVIGCEKYFEKDLMKQSLAYADAAFLQHCFQLIPRSAIELLLIFAVISYLFVSTFFLGKDILQLGSVMGVFAIAALRLIPALTQLMQGLGKLRTKVYALNLIYSDLRGEVERLHSPIPYKQRDIADYRSKFSDEGYAKKVAEFQSQQLPKFTEYVNVEKIHYRYPNAEKTAINSISLRIAKGESIALIGRSGSGKTTLVDILLGLLIPQSGDILVDGVSIYNNLRTWQDQLAYIPQSIFLLDDTIEHNIAFGVPHQNIDHERLLNSIQSAQLDELIKELPDGIHTRTGERGVRLSGGQRQRIGIARAIYHNREILVLDEATSALDMDTERLISESINSLSGLKTLIIIAHRLSTIQNCDRIYKLESGFVEKVGSYQEVVDDVNVL